MKQNKSSILFMARRFPPSIGGMERFAHDFYHELKKHTQVHKISWGGSNMWLPIILPSFFIRGCWQLVTHRDIRVIHLHDATQAPIGWLLHTIFHKPYVIVANGLDITYDTLVYKNCVLPFVRRANAIVAISSSTRHLLEEREFNKSIIYDIPLGIKDDYGVIAQDKAKLEDILGIDIQQKKLLLTTGRLVRRKGVAWFVGNVLPQLIKLKSNILYLVAGEGADHSYIKGVITSSEMTEYVHLLGSVSENEKKMLYQSCDIFIMPNIRVPGDVEGFGIVAHEAATAELPVVASNLQGIPDAIQDHRNGLLVEPEDAIAFTNIIIKLIDNEPDRVKLGKDARQYTLDVFGWPSIINRYIELYHQVEKECDK